MPKMRGGVLSLDMLIEARRRGFAAQLVKGDPASVTDWVRAGKPVILMLQVVDSPGKHFDFFHYVVADGYDPQAGLVRVQFGKGAPRWTTFARIESAWNGGGHAALLVEPKGAESVGEPVEAILRHAVTLEADGKAAEAIPLYRQVIAISPSALAWTNLGDAELAAGDIASAASSFRRALELDPNYRDALNNLAWVLLQRHQVSESESLARKALAQGGPDLDFVYDTLGQVLAEAGRCDDAISAFRSGLAAVPPSRLPARAALELALGNEQRKCGYEVDARASFTAALSHQPDADTAVAIRKALELAGH
jgi:tetratricopeptide (TPR) repeat protein